MQKRFGFALAALACATFFLVDQGSEAQQIARNAYVSSATLWPEGPIAVCWETPGYETEKQMVRNAIERTWERESAVDFTGWGQCAARPSPMPLSMVPMIYQARPNFRIRIADEGPHTRGLGRQLQQIGAGMTLNFTFMNWQCPYSRQQCIDTIAVHEFGHALGFAHEQNRPDTPAWCVEAPQGGNGDWVIGAWDARSVMNYCYDSYPSFGALSPTDIEAVRTAYGPPASPPAGSAAPVPVEANVAPTFGVIALAPGFAPDPQLLTVAAGGSLNATTMQAGCAGWVSHAPDYRIQWTSAGAGPLIFSVASQADTMLVIKDSHGNVWCDDDGGEGVFNPAIRLSSPASGHYDVWVGTYASGAMQPARLRISGQTSE